jgi:NAD(P)-dependent dehydrogenase (short-subunit alcohol dehydrogenase family)
MTQSHESPLILITGGTSKIGRFLVEEYAHKGWRIALHYHENLACAEGLKDRFPIQIQLYKCDFLNSNALERLIGAVVQKQGLPYVLVNNAAYFKRDEIDTAQEALFLKHMKINVWAPLALSKHYSAFLKKENSGVIINMIDQRVWNLTPHFTTYTLSKSCLWTLTQTLALALAPRVRVNGVGLGAMLPDPYLSEEQLSRKGQGVPLQKITTLEEVATSLDFLIHAKSVTGQMIALDNGEHLG